MQTGIGKRVAYQKKPQNVEFCDGPGGRGGVLQTLFPFNHKPGGGGV